MDGFGGGHGGSGGDAVVEGDGVEGVADVIDRDCKDDVHVDDGVVGDGAVEGRGDLWPPGPVEEPGQAGERDCQVCCVAGLLERVDAGGEQGQGLVEVTVNRFEHSGAACDE